MQTVARKNKWLIPIITISVCVCIAGGLAAWREARHRLLMQNAFELFHEDEIREAYQLLLDKAVKGGDGSLEALSDLKKVMLKLRGGWDGFVVDGYYPHRYTSQDLLDEAYWKVAQQVTSEQSPNRREILVMLYETRPLENGDSMKSYQSTLAHFGLDTLDVGPMGLDP